MRRGHFLTAVLAMVAAVSLATADADKPKKKAKPRPTPTPSPEKVYTNEDLQKSTGRKGGVLIGPSPAATASATPVDDTETASKEREWRARAAKLREAVKAAETKVASARARLAALEADLSPTNLMDPTRLQTLAAERAKAREDLAAAEAAQADARKAVEDLEEEARRKGVPPGWLREP
jgi:hypothetical protein